MNMEAFYRGPQELGRKRLQPSDFHSLLSRPGYESIATYVETGTFWGYQLRFAADVFDSVTGIELNEECVKLSREWCHGCDNVTVIHGDTLVELPKLTKRLTDACFFYLDAHWCYGPTDDEGDQLQVLEEGNHPLWGELALLRNRPQGDILFIDDVHTFGLRAWKDITVPAILDYVKPEAHKVCKDGLVLWTRQL
jgi:hypothetical protein